MVDPDITQRLEALEREWVRIGLPMVKHLRSGLTHQEMDGLTHPLGIDLPPELRAVWAWHDGAEFPYWMFSPNMQFPPLQKTVADVRMTMGLDAEFAEDSPVIIEGLWFTPFLALDGGGPTCDCRPAEQVAVYNRHLEDEMTTKPQFPTFAALLDWWLELYVADTFYVPEDSTWPNGHQVAHRGMEIPTDRLKLI